MAALLSSFSALAGGELTPEKIGEIQHEQQKAADAVEKKHGGKKPSELSQDERREMIKEKQASDQAVLDKYGVDKKDFSRASARLSRDDRAAAQAATKAAQKKDAEAEGKPAGQKEIVIEHGNGSNEVNDVNEAQEADRAMGLGAGASDAQPSKKKKR